MKFLLAVVAQSAIAFVARAAHVNYTTVTGFFLQDENSTNATTFDYTTTNFGLINRTYPFDYYCPDHTLTQWQRFDHELAHLNRKAPRNVQYKLLIMGRHGQGWHNAAESFYGTPAWNCYWSLLNGNSSATWADAELTEAGVKQALIANEAWKRGIQNEGMPVPGSWYTSPLQRCLATANLTFAGLPLPAGSKSFLPTIKEGLREGISLHTCDRRHNKTYIASRYAAWPFEASFAETDPYWNGVTAESSAAQDIRSKRALDDIFSADDSKYISITSHSGEIASILRVIGHRVFSLSTGAVIPVLVKAEMVKGKSISTTATYTTSPHCSAPPVTSISAGASSGCICPNSAAPITTPLITLGPFKRSMDQE